MWCMTLKTESTSDSSVFFVPKSTECYRDVNLILSSSSVGEDSGSNGWVCTTPSNQEIDFIVIYCKSSQWNSLISKLVGRADREQFRQRVCQLI